MKHEKQIGLQRRRRRFRVRNALKKHLTRPRLSVFRSHKHMYAQIVDDLAGKTLASASTRDAEVRAALPYGGNRAAAAAVGKAIAQRALAAGLKQVAFDRREYRYHGRVAALADAARDAGLDLGEKAPQPEVEEKPVKAKKGPGKEGAKEKPAKEKPAKGQAAEGKPPKAEKEKKPPKAKEPATED